MTALCSNGLPRRVMFPGELLGRQSARSVSSLPPKPADEQDGGYRFRVLALHVVLLLLCCLVLFRWHRDRLFLGYDGSYYRTMIKLQHTWMPLRPWLSLNPFQALGNGFIAVNSRLSPGYAVAAHLGRGEAGPVLVYTIMAIETFLALLLLARLLGLSASVGYGAAWLLTLLAFPFTPIPLLYPISSLCPQFIEGAAIVSLTIGLFWQVGQAGWIRSVACALLALVVLLWAFVSSPWMPVLIVPVLSLLSLGVLIPGPKRQRRIRLGALILLLFVLAPTVAPYVLGNYLYSGPTFFTGELENLRVDRIWISVVFHGIELGCFGPVLVFGASCGMLLASYRALPIIRSLASVTLVCSLGLIVSGLVIVWWVPTYVGPSPLYFEICLWPFCSLFLSLLVCAVLRQALGWFRRIMPGLVSSRFPLVSLVLPLACLVWSSMVKPAPEPCRLAYPLHQTPIVQTLLSEVQLVPGCVFQGGVATFAGYKDKPGSVNFTDMIGADGGSLTGSGNDHRALGFWSFGIPTLYEYNQFMTPSYYAAISRLLSRPQDKQLRSVIVMTRPRPAYLRSLGIRFLVTDFLEPAWASEVSPVSQSGIRLVQSYQIPNSHRVYHLYELGDPNLSCYSPTRLRVVSTAQESLAQLEQPGFDFHSEALVTVPLPGPLVPAKKVRLTMHKGHALIEATSPGTSLLLLPVQYSHCLELEPLQQAEDEPRLVRVNLLQAGLLFSGSLQVRLRFANGPFRNPYGRILDYLDMKALKLKELCRTNPPASQPGP